MNKLFIFFLLFVVAACDRKMQSGFEVEGLIKNAEAKTVYLEESPLGSMQPVIVDSAHLDKDGKFELKAIAKEESLYNLRLQQSTYPFVSFINDADHITINADLKSEDLYTIKGSPASQTLKDYLYNTGIRLRNIYQVNKAIDSLQQNKASDSLINVRLAEQTRAANELKKYTSEVVSKSKSPALSLFVLGSYQSVASSPEFGIQGYDSKEITAIVNQMAKKFPEHKALASIKNSLETQQQQQATAASTSWLNKPAPNFTLPDVNGNPISLASFKGKYVLVDFWASWCQPCRMENPNVVKAYQQFNTKNFTVLGVSLDREKEPWIKAIKNDGLAWTHVSDLKFWNSEVVGLYNFEGIPYNILLNPEGIVVAENLRGEELMQKLGEVLK